MKNLTLHLLVAAIALSSCGDNDTKAVDAGRDAAPDSPNFPPAPTLGAQIDRMARPAINTALNAAFLDAAPAAQAKKDAYNAATNPATWVTTPLAAGRTIGVEFAANLAVIDVLDQGSAIMDPDGCGNQVLYNGNPLGGGTPTATSYQTLAGILADDLLYVDTMKTDCKLYLSLEFEAATGGAVTHSYCGGRTPSHDVIDTSYSVLAAGTKGFMGVDFIPLIGDGVDVHADITTTFPYFGAPH